MTLELGGIIFYDNKSSLSDPPAATSSMIADEFAAADGGEGEENVAAGIARRRHACGCDRQEMPVVTCQSDRVDTRGRKGGVSMAVKKKATKKKAAKKVTKKKATKKKATKKKATKKKAAKKAKK